MLYVLLLFLLEVVLFATNYTHGTYLLGWDNIMPEFNFPLNFQRAIFSVWQEYRGLGLLDGMAHAANLFHTFYLFLLSLILPASSLRYVFIFLTHLIGGIGFFFLAKNLTGNKKASFLGALFYMLNLGVIQMYYAPLEVFSMHFAALPILFLLTTRALKDFKIKNLLFLFITALLASPQGFVPTVFLTFLILFLSLLFFDFLRNRDLKKIMLVAFVVFSANAFWILPYGFSALKNSSIIQSTRINEFSSEEIFYRNKAFGDISNVLSLKGFMLDSIEYDSKNNSNAYIMSTWRNHSNSIIYKLLFMGLLLVAGFGLFMSIRQRKKEFFPFIFTFVVSFILLGNNTPILEQINTIIRTLFPVVGEVLRFPFTKFIIIFTFCFSVFLTLGLTKIIQKVKKPEKAFVFGLVLALVYLSLPAFRGNFIYPLLKVNLPSDYVKVFNYFNSVDENQRIAFFPIHTFWNWQYRSWGHRGSGFLWYGLKQPILERAFDPWSQYNEQFYNEIFYAVNTEDYYLFNRVLAKYDLKYILLDQSIQSTLLQNPIDYGKLKRFIEKDKNLLLKKTEFGKILIYKTNLSNSWIYSLSEGKTAKVFPSYLSESKDNSIVDLNNYVVSKEDPDVILPFPSLSSLKLQKDLEFDIKEDENSIILLSKQKIKKTEDYLLEIPSLFNNEFLIPIRTEVINGKVAITPIYPKIFINNKEVAIDDQPIIITPNFVNNPKLLILEDAKMEIPFPNGKGYLLKGYPNTIKLKNDLGEETVFINTKALTNITTLIPINEDINEIKVLVEKIKSPFSIERVIEKASYEIKSPNSTVKNDSFANVSKGFTNVKIETKKTSRELVFYKDTLPHQASYILLAETNYESGLPISFYVDNSFENRPELETRLSKEDSLNVVLLPKTEEYFQGYGFHFIVKSEGTETAKSSIGKISIYPFPLDTLKKIRLINKNRSLNHSTKEPLGFKKIANFIYRTDLPNPDSYLVLSQSFDEGWKAYNIEVKSQKSKIKSFLDTYFPFLFGEELKNHVLVNNWANGWALPESGIRNQESGIVILYLPQYLEFLGFFLLFATFFYILRVKP